MNRRKKTLRLRLICGGGFSVSATHQRRRRRERCNEIDEFRSLRLISTESEAQTRLQVHVFNRHTNRRREGFSFVAQIILIWKRSLGFLSTMADREREREQSGFICFIKGRKTAFLTREREAAIRHTGNNPSNWSQTSRLTGISSERE